MAAKFLEFYGNASEYVEDFILMFSLRMKKRACSALQDFPLV